MRQILFATGNQRKVQEANESLAHFGISVNIRPVEADEIQHHDSAEITKAKAKAAYEIIKKPVVAQDTSWSIPALGGFPGGYMKDVADWWSPEDWMNIMSAHNDRTIICSEHIVYFDGTKIKHFVYNFTGHFTQKPVGEKGNSLEKTVIVHGDKTMSQMQENNDVGSSAEALPHWRLFGEWYATISD